MFSKPLCQEARDFESVADDFACCHGGKITSIANSSLAERADLLAKCANWIGKSRAAHNFSKKGSWMDSDPGRHFAMVLDRISKFFSS
jgi:hypothetical protein